MDKINELLDKFESQVFDYTKTNLTVSEGNVGWHIVHSCLVINSVVGSVMKSDPALFKKKFSLKAFFVLLFNQFPRGKAKAPSFTVPSKDQSPESILNHINESRRSVMSLSKAQKNQYFTHPIFGELNTKDTFKLLGVHTYHHVKIIKDILK